MFKVKWKTVYKKLQRSVCRIYNHFEGVFVSIGQVGIIPERDKEFYETKHRGCHKICCCNLRNFQCRMPNKN